MILIDLELGNVFKNGEFAELYVYKRYLIRWLVSIFICTGKFSLLFIQYIEGFCLSSKCFTWALQAPKQVLLSFLLSRPCPNLAVEWWLMLLLPRFRFRYRQRLNLYFQSSHTFLQRSFSTTFEFRTIPQFLANPCLVFD
jgi:hypothetical protein